MKNYFCVLCSLSDISGKALMSHVNNYHNLEISDYYWQHVLKHPSPPVCRYCQNPTRLRSMVRGFRDFCSKNCSTAWRNKNDPVFAANRNAMSIETITKVNFSENYDGARELRKKLLVKNAAKLASFREDHEGRTPAEEILWSNDDFQKLQPVFQDRRFNSKKFELEKISGRGAIMDFSIPPYKLDVELDGWTHKIKDYSRRDRLLHSLGWKVLRFANSEVITNVHLVVDSIYHEIDVIKNSS